MRVFPTISVLACACAAAVPATGQVAASATPVSPAPLDPARLAVARQIVDVVLPPQQRDTILQAMLDAMLKPMVSGIIDGSPKLKQAMEDNPAAKQVMADFVKRQRDLGLTDIRAALPDLVEAYAHAYARNFTLDELTAIRDFAKTSAGAKFLQRGSALMSDPDVGAWQRRIMATQMERQPAELRKFQNDMSAALKNDPKGS